MSRSLRWFLISGTVFVAVLCIAAVFVLQSGWLRETVRQRAISKLEWSTGTRADIQFLRIDWRSRTLEIKSLVLHGSEAPDTAPLFAADEVRIGFTLSSLLSRSDDLQSVQIQHPQIHLIAHPDGSTNIPQPGHGRNHVIESLLDLRVHRFTASNGILRINLRQIPLQFDGRDMQVNCRYEPWEAAYELQFSSNDTSVESRVGASVPLNIDGRLRLESTQLIVQNLQLGTGSSNLSVSGRITNFATLATDFQFSAHVRAVDTRRFWSSEDWRGGDAMLAGSAHYDSLHGVAFRGTLTGRGLSYRSASLDISGVDLDTDLAGTPDRLQFPHLVLRALGARLTGDAELAHLNKLHLNANATQLDLNRAASKLFKGRLPWDAQANGRIEFSSDFTQRVPQSVVKARLNLQPASSAPPVSGSVDFIYRTPARSLLFNPSQLNLPNTRLSFSGEPGGVLQLALDSTNLSEVSSTLSDLGISGIPALPVLERNGSAHFDGMLTALQTSPQIAGHVTLANFSFNGRHWNMLRAQVGLSPQMANFTSFTLAGGPSRITGKGRLELTGWKPTANGQINVDARFQGILLAQMLFPQPVRNESFWTRIFSSDVASGSAALSGPLSNPLGHAQLRLDDTGTNGFRTTQVQVGVTLEPGQIRLTQGRMQSGSALILFSGTYAHPANSWRDGQLALKMDSNGFPLAGVPEWRRFEPAVNGTAEIHGQGAIRITGGHIEPAIANGTLKLRNVTYNGQPAGALTVDADTSGSVLKTKLTGDLRGHSLSGAAEIQLVDRSPIQGDVQFERFDLGIVYAILYPGRVALPLNGAASGRIAFNGPLLQPADWRSIVKIDTLELRPKLPKSSNTSTLAWHNAGPIVFENANHAAKISSFKLGGNDTSLSATGSIHYGSNPTLDVRLNGSVNLQILQLFNPSLQSSGHAAVTANLGGTFGKPALTGTFDIAQGSFFSPNLPNGLSNVNGRITFNRDRATIQQLKAQTGGGTLSLTGFVGFGSPGPLLYHVQASAGNVRLHYGAGISITADADLRLTGSSRSSILSGTATVSRVVFNPNVDIGNVLAAFGAAAAAPASTNDFVSGLHLDVALESAPNLQLSTSLSRDVEAEINLRLRGTPGHPLLLGSIAANQGDIKVFGTKYRINHGEVSFQNIARIEPILDLDLQTQTHGITVNITISGTINRLNIAYRSDPPLQPKDIIALLTVGRAPSSSNVQNTQNPTDVTAVQGGTVLGQAISSPPSRLSKLFGVTNVKIDPMVQGIITNTPQARLTLEEQVSRNFTVTYVTNLSQTSEQIFRVEWALNPQYSVVAVRDENGEFGIDIQYKKHF